MTKKTIRSVVALAALSAPTLMAGEPLMPQASSAITADLTLGYHSDYVYRGAMPEGSDDVFTFGAGINYDDGSGNDWFAGAYYRNIDVFAEGSNLSPAEDYDDHATVMAGVRRELMPSLTGTLAYAFNSGGVYKNSSGTDEEGHEVQAMLEWAVSDCFDVYGLAAYDFGGQEGFYLEAGATYTYVINDQVSLEFSGAIAASYGFWAEVPVFPGVDNDGLNHYELKLTVPVIINDQLTLKPYIAYVAALDVLEDYADFPGQVTFPVGDTNSDSEVIGGVEAILRF